VTVGTACDAADRVAEDADPAVEGDDEDEDEDDDEDDGKGSGAVVTTTFGATIV